MPYSVNEKPTCKKVLLSTANDKPKVKKTNFAKKSTAKSMACSNPSSPRIVSDSDHLTGAVEHENKVINGVLNGKIKPLKTNGYDIDTDETSAKDVVRETVGNTECAILPEQNRTGLVNGVNEEHSAESNKAPTSLSVHSTNMTNNGHTEEEAEEGEIIEDNNEEECINNKTVGEDREKKAIVTTPNEGVELKKVPNFPLIKESMKDKLQKTNVVAALNKLQFSKGLESPVNSDSEIKKKSSMPFLLDLDPVSDEGSGSDTTVQPLTPSSSGKGNLFENLSALTSSRIKSPDIKNSLGKSNSEEIDNKNGCGKSEIKIAEQKNDESCETDLKNNFKEVEKRNSDLTSTGRQEVTPEKEILQKSEEVTEATNHSEALPDKTLSPGETNQEIADTEVIDMTDESNGADEIEKSDITKTEYTEDKTDTEISGNKNTNEEKEKNACEITYVVPNKDIKETNEIVETITKKRSSSVEKTVETPESSACISEPNEEHNENVEGNVIDMTEDSRDAMEQDEGSSKEKENPKTVMSHLETQMEETEAENENHEVETLSEKLIQSMEVDMTESEKVNETLDAEMSENEKKVTENEKEPVIERKDKIQDEEKFNALSSKSRKNDANESVNLGTDSDPDVLNISSDHENDEEKTKLDTQSLKDELKEGIKGEVELKKDEMKDETKDEADFSECSPMSVPHEMNCTTSLKRSRSTTPEEFNSGKRTRLDSMIGKLGASLGVKPDEVKDEVNCADGLDKKEDLDSKLIQITKKVK